MLKDRGIHSLSLYSHTFDSCVSASITGFTNAEEENLKTSSFWTDFHAHTAHISWEYLEVKRLPKALMEDYRAERMGPSLGSLRRCACVPSTFFTAPTRTRPWYSEAQFSSHNQKTKCCQRHPGRPSQEKVGLNEHGKASRQQSVVADVLGMTIRKRKYFFLNASLSFCHVVLWEGRRDCSPSQPSVPPPIGSLLIRSCFLSQWEHHTVLEISVNMLDLKITGVLLGPLGIPWRTPAKERLCSLGARIYKRRLSS